MPEGTIRAFEDHGTLARTIDVSGDDDERVLERLEAVGVSTIDVGRTLEEEGATTFIKSFDELIQTLDSKKQTLWNERGDGV